MDKSITVSLKLTLLSLFIILSGFANSQVSEEWIHRYTGPEPSTDTPSDFAIDSAGNFYVTGQSTIGGGYADIITVKYNSNGVRQWIAKYNGAENLLDNGNSVKVHSDGNVYVSGNTYSTSEEYNIVVIKYDPTGNEQWVRQYNGPGNFEDLIRGSALDENGNLYVCGSSYGSSTSYDFVLLKYNSSGNPAMDSKMERRFKS